MTTYAETVRTAGDAPAIDGYTTADARVDLAAAHRLAVLDDLHEGTWNHFSLTDPEDPSAILISPSYVHWSQVTASSLEHLGSDEEAAKRDSALWVAYRIHYPIHRARPDARCVLHVHSPSVVALSMLDVKLNKAEQNALMFHGRVAYTDEYDGLWPNGLEQGQRMAESLGDNMVLMLRSHGAVVVGKSVGEAYTGVYTLERAARAQVLAMSTGLPLLELSESELARMFAAEPTAATSGGLSYFDKHFIAMKRVLDREQPDYRA